MKQINRIVGCLLLIFLMALVSSAAPKKLAIVGAHVINPDGKKSYRNATLLIEGNRIVRVGPARKVRVPSGFSVIDASGKWVIPGLIDAHIHFFQSGGLYTRPDIIDLRKYVPYEEKELVDIKKNLRDTFARYIRCGITGVVDMGGPFWNFEVRAEADTTLLAPRVVLPGPLVSTYQPEKLTTNDPPIIKVHTEEEARELVRKQVAAGTDFIKIWYIVRRGQKPEDNYPLVKATIDESHKHGLRVAVHATQLQTAKLAVKAGAKILVHSVYDREVDREFIRMLKKNKVLYIPTLVVFEGYLEALTKRPRLSTVEILLANPYFLGTLFDVYEIPDSDFPPIPETSVQARLQRIEIAKKNLKKLQDAGVLIAAGTDAGNIGTFHGPAIFREFELMQEAGLTPKQILTSATLNGARVMGMENELGFIEKGKLADLVILNSNPLEKITNTADIYAVVKDGHVFWPEDILHPTPEDVVQTQLNAYNARNLEAFAATYAEDIQIYNFPDELRYSGIDRLKERYGRLFQNAPNLHAQIKKRIVLGDYVLDREHASGFPSGRTADVVAIYQVKNGKISKVWFIRKK